jgi:hypothetical protein
MVPKEYAYIHTYMHKHVHIHAQHTSTLYAHTGDGICSMPEEYPGFGRFGCIKDCGRFKNTTKIYISMQEFFDLVKAVDGWDLSKTTPFLTRPNPIYTYNIWSK